MAKVLGAGLKAVILTGSKERMIDLDGALWTDDPASFLPHGIEGSEQADQQPLYITTTPENPAGATVLVLTDGATAAGFDGYDRCLEMFDGNDVTMVEAARARWKSYKEQGHDLTYWQQTDSGGVVKKGLTCKYMFTVLFF